MYEEQKTVDYKYNNNYKRSYNCNTYIPNGN